MDRDQGQEGGVQVFRRFVTVVSATAIVLSLASTATAAEAVPTVEVSGTVVGPDGTVVPVKAAWLLEHEFEGAEGIRTDVVVAADGTFTVALRAWGTAEAPARARIVAEGHFGEEEVDEQGCVIARAPVGSMAIEIPGVVPVDPIEVVMDDENVIGACTATPAPTPEASEAPQAPEAPEAPGITLPPTDASASPATQGAGIAWLGVLLLALSTMAVLFRPRRRVER